LVGEHSWHTKRSNSFHHALAGRGSRVFRSSAVRPRRRLAGLAADFDSTHAEVRIVPPQPGSPANGHNCQRSYDKQRGFLNSVSVSGIPFGSLKPANAGKSPTKLPNIPVLRGPRPETWFDRSLRAEAVIQSQSRLYRSARGSGEPAWATHCFQSASDCLGPDPRRALGPAAIPAAPTGRTRDLTRFY
jgi:hypothetical protein